MPSEGAPIQKINHIESPFWGLCKAVRNAIADSPTGRSLQSLYMALAYICWVQIFALLFHIKTSVPCGAMLPEDFVVIVTFSPFCFHAMPNALSEKISFNENAIYLISL